jgi:hypothetical protein
VDRSAPALIVDGLNFLNVRVYHLIGKVGALVRYPRVPQSSVLSFGSEARFIRRSHSAAHLSRINSPSMASPLPPTVSGYLSRGID